MSQRYFAFWLGMVLLMGGCGEGVLDPGEVARPLTGTYTLESRSFVLQDSARTVLDYMEPPEVRSFLTLVRNGRYGQIDTVETASGTQVFIETGRWSILGDQLFIETDTDRTATELFTYDGIRLVRTLPDLPSSAGYYSVVDVWRRR